MAFPIQFPSFVPVSDSRLRGFHRTHRICENQWAVNLALRQPQNGPLLHQELKLGNGSSNSGTAKVQQPQKVGLLAWCTGAELHHLVITHYGQEGWL